MAKRLIQFFLIAFIFFVGLFLLPSQASAVKCSECNAAYEGCSNACGIVPLSSVCRVGCTAQRTLCVSGGPGVSACTPDTTTLSATSRFCLDHPTDAACPNPKAGGELCNNNEGIQTAIGCVPTRLDQFFPALIRYSFAIAGVIAFLFMILGAFQMITSGGNPESVKKGREQFIAAASGLVFIILSSVLLRIIGVDILAIPGF